MKKYLCLDVQQVVQEKERCTDIERHTVKETDKVPSTSKESDLLKQKTLLVLL